MINKQVSLKTGAFIIALAGFLLVGSTLAFLNAFAGSKTNTFSGDRSNVNIAIVEKKPDGTVGQTDPIETGNGQRYNKLVNGGTVEKEIAVHNYDKKEYKTGDTLVRVRVVPSFVYDSGEHAGTTIACDMSKIKLLANENNSTEGNWAVINNSGTSNQDYYYYSLPVDPDTNTDFLKFTVSYDGVIPEGASLVLEVLTEGISYNAGNDRDGWKFAKEAWELSSSDVAKIQNAQPLKN